MEQDKLLKFNSDIKIIGINPYVFLPENVLLEIFKQSKKDKGHIPVCGTVNGQKFRQTLVKYKGEWRLYIYTTMLKDSPRRIGEEIIIEISYDPESRVIDMPISLQDALKADLYAKTIFDKLSPSKKSEIIKYLVRLKTNESRERNIQRIINYLHGKESFFGDLKIKKS